MKVRYRRSGGFGGLTAGCDLDTETMSASEARELAALVEACGDEGGAGPSAEARDTVLHEIVLEGDDGSRRTLSFDELGVPPSAGPLLSYLESRSSPREPG